MPNHRLQTRFGSVVFFLCCRQSINSAGKAVDSKWALLTADVQHPLDLNFVQQVKQLTQHYGLQLSSILWIWILFSRLNSWLKMSIIDCSCPNSFGFEDLILFSRLNSWLKTIIFYCKCPTSFGFEFCSASKQLTQNAHYWQQISHILWIWILFRGLNSCLKMSIIDCRFHTSFGFFLLDSKCPLLTADVTHTLNLNFGQ